MFVKLEKDYSFLQTGGDLNFNFVSGCLTSHFGQEYHGGRCWGRTTRHKTLDMGHETQDTRDKWVICMSLVALVWCSDGEYDIILVSDI